MLNIDMIHYFKMHVCTGLCSEKGKKKDLDMEVLVHYIILCSSFTLSFFNDMLILL